MGWGERETWRASSSTSSSSSISIHRPSLLSGCHCIFVCHLRPSSSIPSSASSSAVPPSTKLTHRASLHCRSPLSPLLVCLLFAAGAHFFLSAPFPSSLCVCLSVCLSTCCPPVLHLSVCFILSLVEPARKLSAAAAAVPLPSLLCPSLPSASPSPSPSLSLSLPNQTSLKGKTRPSCLPPAPSCFLPPQKKPPAARLSSSSALPPSSSSFPARSTPALCSSLCLSLPLSLFYYQLLIYLPGLPSFLHLPSVFISSLSLPLFSFSRPPPSSASSSSSSRPYRKTIESLPQGQQEKKGT